MDQQGTMRTAMRCLRTAALEDAGAAQITAAFEGMIGAVPVDVRNAVYGA